MVYYDQRGAGNVKGNYSINSLNLEQLSKDLEMLVKSIKRYDAKANIYLLGYSFGGTLGTYYL